MKFLKGEPHINIKPTVTGGTINEFHYDTVGGDQGEFVEVCLPAGTDPSTFTISLYNGSGGAVYDTFALSTASTVCTNINGFDYYAVDTPNIQNGAPDGIALDNGGALCEFISYEGAFTGVGGPADGVTSTSVGVSGAPLPAGESISLVNGVWEAGVPATPGKANICFLSGTKIQTPTGYKNIETLKVGDIVNTASGKQLPVKWVGIQTVEINSNRNLLKSNPVLIQANALGEGIPSSDLSVSPNHAIYVDGLLINAGALVNGVNIYQEEPTEDFKYYHVELDSHELVIAQNTWAESYLPQNENRDDFDNAAAFDQQYPNGRKLILWPLDYPRISSQAKVPDYIQDMILKKEEIRKIA